MTLLEPGRILCPWCRGERGYWYDDGVMNGAGGWYDCVACGGVGDLAEGPYAQQQTILAEADAFKAKALVLIREINFHLACVPT